VNRIAGSKTSANAPALSQENLRFLSCHGQINRKFRPPLKGFFPAACGKVYCKWAARSRWQRTRKIGFYQARRAHLNSEKPKGGWPRRYWERLKKYRA
jgi:hypothetical protein